MSHDFSWCCELCNRVFAERAVFEIGCHACRSAREVALPKPDGKSNREWFGVNVARTLYDQEAT